MVKRYHRNLRGVFFESHHLGEVVLDQGAEVLAPVAEEHLQAREQLVVFRTEWQEQYGIASISLLGLHVIVNAIKNSSFFNNNRKGSTVSCTKQKKSAVPEERV